MKRLFVAIDFHLDDDFLNYIQQIRLKMSKLDKTTWVQPHLMHLTLKFLGDTPEWKIPKISYMLNEQTEKTKSFDCTMTHLGVFGSHSHPNVLWIGVHAEQILFDLNKNIETSLKSIGYKPYYGHFVPHVTLARINRLDDKNMFWTAVKTMQDKFSSQYLVSSIKLYESILKKGYNPIYEQIAEFPLLNS
mgnify:CR=1 FL=1